jgi:hypothetical protein
MKFLKGLLNLLIVSFTIVALFVPVVVFIHEATHYIMYTMEGIEVTSFHVLDSDSLTKGRSGYITPVKESKYGNQVQEGIAYLSSCLFLASTLLFCLVKPLKLFTIRQLELMGTRRGTHQFTTKTMS